MDFVQYHWESKIDAKLGSVLEGKKWIWPPARSKEMVSIQIKLAMVEIGIVDKPRWIISKKGIHTSAEAGLVF